jgi:hypothetical protein
MYFLVGRMIRSHQVVDGCYQEVLTLWVEWGDDVACHGCKLCIGVDRRKIYLGYWDLKILLWLGLVYDACVDVLIGGDAKGVYVVMR